VTDESIQPDATPDAPRTFSSLGTRLCLALWLGAMLLASISTIDGSDPVADFEQPAAVLVRGTEHTLQVADAIERAADAKYSADLQKVLDRSGQLESGAQLYRDLAARLEVIVAGAGEGADASRRVDRLDQIRELKLRAAVLGAEAGTDDWRDGLADVDDERVEALIATLAGEPFDGPEPNWDDLGSSYSRALIELRRARRDGATRTQTAWEDWQLESGDDLMARVADVLATALAAGLLGLLAFQPFAFLRADRVRLDPPGDPNCWPETPDGLGIFARYAVLFLVIGTTLALLDAGLREGSSSPLQGVTGLLASAPLLLLAASCYRGAEPGALVRHLGLGFDTTRMLRLPAFVAAGWVLTMSGALAVGALAAAAGHRNDMFANPFLDLIAGASDTSRMRLMVEACIWAPLFEELGFRAALFGGLRRRLPFLPAALLSSALFGLAHAYDPVGMLTIAWVGVSLAWVYERTRSLWAPILVHALYNFISLKFTFLFV